MLSGVCDFDWRAGFHVISRNSGGKFLRHVVLCGATLTGGSPRRPVSIEPCPGKRLPPHNGFVWLSVIVLRSVGTRRNVDAMMRSKDSPVSNSMLASRHFEHHACRDQMQSTGTRCLVAEQVVHGIFLDSAPRAIIAGFTIPVRYS